MREQIDKLADGPLCQESLNTMTGRLQCYTVFRAQADWELLRTS
jgi:hypothetical protein